MREMGERIRVARTERGWSQEALGAMVELSGMVLSLYERGESAPTPYTLRRIARALDVKLSWLMKGATELTGTGKAQP